MEKITIKKGGKLIFDGSRVTNGHWAISLDACTASFVFNEPYQCLIENGLSFHKDHDMRPMLQSELPNIALTMQEGEIPATITNVTIDGARIVRWEKDGEAGTVAFRSDYIWILENLGSYHTLNKKHNGMLAACDGDRVLAVLMPVASSKEETKTGLAPVWSALQMELSGEEVVE